MNIIIVVLQFCTEDNGGNKRIRGSGIVGDATHREHDTEERPGFIL